MGNNKRYPFLKKNIPGWYILFFSLLCNVPPYLGGQPLLLPPQETFVYRRIVDKKVEEVRVQSRLVQNREKSYYEIQSISPSQKSILFLRIPDLFAFYTETTTVGKTSTVRRITEILEEKTPFGETDLLISSAENIPFSLRRFPWGAQKKGRILFSGIENTSSSFVFELTVVGIETIRINNSTYECYKVHLSVSGIFGALFGKTTIHYSTSTPGFLVRSEGISGPPGSPRVIMELIEYQAQ